ncbi:MAG TPA: acetyl-CoA carboxylase carboxyltransferase subunit beta [Candidatus Omnitrophica bacterium]|nr:acetyl-CoA carboxylase carboxyltransferase subunit beta [Candidatus Omnitrophota bacterium]
MVWYRRVGYIIKAKKKKDIPGGLWTKCPSCGRIIYNQQLARNLKVCPKCDYHFRLPARERLSYLVDKGTFEEVDANILPVDPLKFEDTKPYRDRIKDAQEKTGLTEGAITGEGEIGSIRAAIGVLDFNFLGGSMASVVGEKTCRLIEQATKKEIPLVMVSASGGARMQEGILSLMQMVKTSAALNAYSKKDSPYISILTDPTTGGVSASFAFLADIIIAEPRALIGFAGLRVVGLTIGKHNGHLLDGLKKAQTSESLLEHGMVDMVVHRKNLKPTVVKLLKFFA